MHKAVPIDYGDGPECRTCGEPVIGDKHASDPAAAPPPPRPEYRGPLVRTDDPGTAHEAAAAIEPHRDSAKGRVLALLKARHGEWIDAVEFTTPLIGGFAGTRRLRELRDAGWPIETRRKPDGSNTWQHRLVGAAPGAAEAVSA